MIKRRDTNVETEERPFVLNSHFVSSDLWSLPQWEEDTWASENTAAPVKQSRELASC